VAYVNEPLAEMIRVPREELIGQMTPDFYQDPADREAYLTGLREKGQVSNYDLPLKRGDGDSFWTLVSGRVINFQGDPAIISSLVDITERKQHEATALIEGQHQAAINEILEYATTSSSLTNCCNWPWIRFWDYPGCPFSLKAAFF
jgi:PAS domain S-box-containing protein